MKPLYQVLVTSGGTQEYIDDVRVMTNISTGKLGSIIASNFASFNHCRVHFVYGKNTTVPKNCLNINLYQIRSSQEAMDKIKELVPNMDAVIHSMAVSDFTFKRDAAVKCKSSDPEAFIEYMRKTITLNPKIISHIKEWNPDTFLVGFKFEVGTSEEELAALAQASLEKNKCDLVIANDKEEMKRLGTHRGHFFYSEALKNRGFRNFIICGKDTISAFIYSTMIQVWEEK
jgi:phosphopantothenate-cysteine ligase